MMESNNCQGFSENMRRNVSPEELTQALFLHTCDKFEWIAKVINELFSKYWHENTIREPINDEIHVLYEDLYDDNDVSDDIMNPFDHLSPTPKFEKGDLLSKILEELVLKDMIGSGSLVSKDDNT